MTDTTPNPIPVPDPAEDDGLDESTPEEEAKKAKK